MAAWSGVVRGYQPSDALQSGSGDLYGPVGMVYPPRRPSACRWRLQAAPDPNLCPMRTAKASRGICDNVYLATTLNVHRPLKETRWEMT